jgi:uncharacterized protein (TIGR02117 family)
MVTALMVMLLPACGDTPRRAAAQPAARTPGSASVIYVVRRSWHTDIGFEARDLPAPLSSVRSDFPAAQYLIFGFGDRRYLLANKPDVSNLLAALWPGPGLILVTGLTATPQAGFGQDNVIVLSVTRAQAQGVADFISQSMARGPGGLQPVAAGPYEGSLFYASTRRYSAIDTCNHWTAQALQTAPLPYHSFGVEFAGQIWSQVRRTALATPSNPAPLPPSD